MVNKIPPYIKKILAALLENGFEAYVAGGAVRDLLLNLTPGDFDVATAATPENVIKICRQHSWHTIDKLGNNFGCVVAVVDNVPVEITTFRGEAYGNDAHKPDKVWYCDNLKDDCSRRDFTVNAMALDLNGKLYDFYNGRQDLENKILRTVGNAWQRYNEDALRMLRACRFTAQLGFRYVQEDNLLPTFGEENTPYYMPQSFKFPVERCSGLSLDRVRKELDKLLVAEQAGKGLMLLAATGITDAKCRLKQNGVYTSVPILPELRHLVGLKQNPRFHKYDTWEHTLAAVDNSPRLLSIRWALLLHDIGKGLPDVRTLNKEGQPTDPGHEAKSALMARQILERLRYPKDFIKLVVWLIAQHMRFAPMLATGEKTLLRWVRSEAASGYFRSQQEMTEAYTQLVEVFLADMGATHAAENTALMDSGRELGKQVIELTQKKMPVTAGDLAVSGKDLLQHIPHAEMKNMLKYLLDRVQSGSLPNDNSALLNAVKKRLLKKGGHHEKL